MPTFSCKSLYLKAFKPKVWLKCSAASALSGPFRCNWILGTSPGYPLKARRYQPEKRMEMHFVFRFA